MSTHRGLIAYVMGDYWLDVMVMVNFVSADPTNNLVLLKQIQEKHYLFLILVKIPAGLPLWFNFTERDWLDLSDWKSVPHEHVYHTLLVVFESLLSFRHFLHMLHLSLRVLVKHLHPSFHCWGSFSSRRILLLNSWKGWSPNHLVIWEDVIWVRHILPISLLVALVKQSTREHYKSDQSYKVPHGCKHIKIENPKSVNSRPVLEALVLEKEYDRDDIF